MAKLTLSDISNLADTTASQTTINANSALIETALENTVSRNGLSPNNMSGNIDMNGHSILNLTKPVGVNDAAREQDILDAVTALGVNADIITGGGAISLTTQVTGVLPVANGGTGTATYVMGDILSSNSANTLSRIPGNITATRKFLMSQGTSTIASPVQWAQIVGSDIAGTPLTKTDDTNVTLTLGGSSNVALLNPASITVGWTGTLGVSRGGTGFGSYAVGDLLFASGAAALSKLADVATGNVLISGGVGVAPSYGKVTTSHISGTTGSGNFVLDTTPTLVTPVLGVATATSINKVALTAPATAATLTIANNKTLTANNSLTLAGTDATTITFQGTDTYVGRTTTDTLTNKTLVAPALGAATATSINGLTITSSTGTFTLTNAKTLAVTNTLTLSGTDSTVMTFPSATGTVLTADSTATLTNKTFNSAGTGNVLQVSGVTVSRGQYPGTNTNDTATAGNIGETVSASVGSGSAVALTTGTAANITSISLTAGHWLIHGGVLFRCAAATTLNGLNASISTTTAAIDFATPGVTYNTIDLAGAAPGNLHDTGVNVARTLSIAGTTTVFLVASPNFSGSTLTGFGSIFAIRMR